MDVIVQIGDFLASSFLRIWSAIGTWGVIGVGIIAPVVIRKVAGLFKRILQF